MSKDAAIKWLTDRLAKRGAKVALAKALDVPPSRVTEILNGRKIKAHEVPIIARFFNITNEAVVSGLSGEDTTPPKAVDYEAAAFMAVDKLAETRPLSAADKLAMVRALKAALESQ